MNNVFFPIYFHVDDENFSGKYFHLVSFTLAEGGIWFTLQNKRCACGITVT